MKDHEYEIGGLILGNDRSNPIFVENVEYGSAEWVDQDEDNPVGDGRVFGRDRLRGNAWTFALVIGCDTEGEARDVLGQLTRVWRDRKMARTPGAQKILRYMIDGEVRRIYGRPRNFAISDSSGLSQGVVVVTAEFVTSDARHFADLQNQVTLRLVTDEQEGLFGDWVDPLLSAPAGVRSGFVTVAGLAETHVEITFNGPVSNPSVSGAGWAAGWTGTLESDERVTIDTRSNTVLLGSGASVAGGLSRDTYLEDVRLQPGTQELIFTGTDPTGTASANIRWHVAEDGL